MRMGTRSAERKPENTAKTVEQTIEQKERLLRRTGQGSGELDLALRTGAGAGLSKEQTMRFLLEDV